MDPDVVKSLDGLAGLASLVTSLLLVPTIMALRKIATKHEGRLDDHDRDIAELKATKKPSKKPRRRTLL